MHKIAIGPNHFKNDFYVDRHLIYVVVCINIAFIQKFAKSAKIEFRLCKQHVFSNHVRIHLCKLNGNRSFGFWIITKIQNRIQDYL